MDSNSSNEGYSLSTSVDTETLAKLEALRKALMEGNDNG